MEINPWVNKEWKQKNGQKKSYKRQLQKAKKKLIVVCKRIAVAQDSGTSTEMYGLLKEKNR